MFSLLKSSAGTHHLSEPIHWQQTVVNPNFALQQQEPSFLDRLAAPTVFLQQALVFETSLDSDTVQAAVAAVLQLYTPFGHRLTSGQVSTTARLARCCRTLNRRVAATMIQQ
jgi:hypothetical protein